jgi:hypothetical protein
MIWAFLAWYFFGGGVAGGTMLSPAYVDELSERVAIVVVDPARSETAQQTLKILGKEVKAFDKAFAKSGKQLSKFYKDHAADRNEAVAIIDALNANWEAAQERALDLRFELRESLSEDEWTKLLASPEQAP